jgi:N-methylhydantoinase B
VKLDNTTLQVLANYCAAAAESMGWTLMRTAYSTFVKETEDFSCQVLTRDGLTVASPKTFGATWYTGLDYGGVTSLFDYEEGDIYVTSDPYTGNVATHTPDIHMWKPVFRDGEIVCFVGNHIHNTDVGGAVPATLSRTLTEIQQEGLRIPPMRLMHGGVLNQDLLAIIAHNVRLPEQNWGDLNAQIACINVGERKIHEILDRFGKADFIAGLEQLLDYAESQARAVIAQIPDGEYFFADYADEDQTGGYPVRVAVTLKVHGDTLTVDFTGSDPQLASSLNMPTGGKERHSLVTVGTVYALYCLDPTMMLNAGLMRPTRAVLPEGTVVNAVKPAAVGMRSLLCNLAQTVTIGAFCRAVPERLPASPGSAVSIMNVKTSTRSGQPIMASIGPVGGRRRGGTGLEMEFQLDAPQSLVTARNRDRSVFSAWGLVGGRAGAVSRFIKNPGTSKAVDLGSQDIVPCDPGDIILIQGPGAGGYGSPLERPVTDVLTDVKRGLVSAERARLDYGVVIGPELALDDAATVTLRAQMAGEADSAEFGYGPGRLAFEKVWTRGRYAALTRILAEVPVTWRYFVKHQIFHVIKTPPSESGQGAADVYRAYEDVVARFTDLPRVAPEDARV